MQASIFEMTRQKPLDEAEKLAEQWLKSQGYVDVQRPQSDPPDFVVAGRYAVEVTRLNEMLTVDDDDKHTKSETEVRIPLYKCIEKTFATLGSPGNAGKRWEITCEYDLSRPLPSCKTVRSEVSGALKPLLVPYDDRVISSIHTRHFDHDKHAGEISCMGFPHLCLACGICLELHHLCSSSEKFILVSVSNGKGGQVAYELKEGVEHSLRVKSKKIRDQNKKDKYSSWWLILVDNVCFAPLRILSKNELSFIRNQNFDFWSRVVIVSSKNLNSYYNLLGDSAGDGGPFRGRTPELRIVSPELNYI